MIVLLERKKVGRVAAGAIDPSRGARLVFNDRLNVAIAALFMSVVVLVVMVVLMMTKKCVDDEDGGGGGGSRRRRRCCNCVGDVDGD